MPNTVSLNYGIVLGLETMKRIDLDTSVKNETISWSDELSTPMVPQSFWSKERIAKLIESASHKKSNDPNSDGDPTISELFATEFKPNDYKKPHLTAVVAKKRFHIYPDASSKHAMGAVLVQEDKTVSTFSTRFNEAQLKYTVTEQELLAILEACKHFKNIIHGCDITVHTDHKNFTYSPTQRANARVERSMILLNEEFGVTLEHIKGKDNTGGDGLSTLAFSDTTSETDAIFAIQATEGVRAYP